MNTLSIFPQFLDYQFYAPLLLRLALGAIFLVHGWAKLSGGIPQFALWLESLKFTPGKFWAWVVALTESCGAVFLFAGFLTQLTAFILAVQFLVIIFWARKGQPFVAKPEAPGMSREFDFLIFFALLTLLILGPGPFSLDLPL